MNILAIDSSTEACSAALLREDGAIFSEFLVAPKQHNKLLPQMMSQVLSASGLAKSALSYCAFANGPGAFTGIRIAAAQAQGVAIALDIPLLPISTLAVLAQAGIKQFDTSSTLVALDARMQEIYWAIYQRDEQGCARLKGREQLSTVAEVIIDDDVKCGVGHGWVDDLRAGVNFPVDHGMLPDAKFLLQLAHSEALANRSIGVDQIRINYLRNRVAEKAKA